MKCCWCDGTYESCGCNEGTIHDHCEHCNHGVVTDPPYGPVRYLREEGDFLLERADFDNLNWDSFHITGDIYVMAQEVAKIFNSSLELTPQDIKIFQDYWDDLYRDETIGDVLQRIALFSKKKVLSISNP